MTSLALYRMIFPVSLCFWWNTNRLGITFASGGGTTGAQALTFSIWVSSTSIAPNHASVAEVQSRTEVQTWTLENWTKVQSKVQMCCWTECYVRLSIQADRISTECVWTWFEPDFGLMFGMLDHACRVIFLFYFNFFLKMIRCLCSENGHTDHTRVPQQI